MSALIDGLIAGYGIAIPLGAVSVLIVNRSIDEGFRSGFAAGAGTATVDALCASLVIFAGVLVSSLLSPFATPLQLLGGTALILMGIFGARKSWRAAMPENTHAAAKECSDWRTFFQFIAITALNPFTAIYFLALIMGGGTSWISSPIDSALFIAGVTFASLSWQTLLAAGGALAQKRLSVRAKMATVIIGNLIVVLLGINLLLA
ncbi:MAG: LysE family transporter [Methanomassiliicoccus sp.]|nr:LysE family transporter [Methanomassiliicoccus sp.]